MKRRIVAWLRWVLVRLDPVADPALLAAASALIADAERTFGRGFGEAKRHAVYAGLIKAYPTHAKRDLSRVIEDAL